ncbi:MAG: protein kinase domain-containing protein [Myxococcota bacterium]
MRSSAALSAELCPSESEVLALVCGELEAAALARLIAHSERCGVCALIIAETGLVIAQRHGNQGPSSISGMSSPTVFTPGQLVASRYRIEQRVGRGGMGEVYSALDQEFGERVALKTICPAFASEPRVVDRFKLELRLARSISHPNVCRVLEFGRHELSNGTSQCFFTLQFIEGVTLRRRILEAGPLELIPALSLAQNLALGLNAIHAQNVVHRDIKPENVMLAPEPGPASAIWVDFGLARVDLRESLSGGVLAGTPDYTAPELLRGGIASRASDVYAFGVMMYELLTGALPFPRSASFLAASERRATQPSAPSSLRREIPPALDALVLQCLEDSPERRPPSALHIANRLRDVASALNRGTTRRTAACAPLDGKAASRCRLLVSLAIAATGAGLVLYHSPDEPESSPASATELTLAPRPSAMPPNASAVVPTPDLALPPERKLAPRRVIAAPLTTTAPSAEPAAQPSLRTLPDFGGRR